MRNACPFSPYTITPTSFPIQFKFFPHFHWFFAKGNILVLIFPSHIVYERRVCFVSHFVSWSEIPSETGLQTPTTENTVTFTIDVKNDLYIFTIQLEVDGEVVKTWIEGPIAHQVKILHLHGRPILPRKTQL